MLRRSLEPLLQSRRRCTRRRIWEMFRPLLCMGFAAVPVSYFQSWEGQICSCVGRCYTTERLPDQCVPNIAKNCTTQHCFTCERDALTISNSWWTRQGVGRGTRLMIPTLVLPFWIFGGYEVAHVTSKGPAVYTVPIESTAVCSCATRFENIRHCTSPPIKARSNLSPNLRYRCCLSELSEEALWTQIW